MAEATLNDVIGRLRTDNAKQLEEQRDTTNAIQSLSAGLNALLVQLELQALRDKEAEAERKREATAAKSKATTSSGGSDGPGFLAGLMPGGILGGIARSIGSIAAFSAGLVLATEGLGPSLRDFRLFTRTITRIFTFPARFTADLGRAFGGGSLSNYIRNQVTRLDDFFSRRYTFNEATGRYQRLASRFGGGTGFVPAREVSRYQRMLISVNGIFTRISRMFNAIRIPQELITRLSRTQGVLMNALGMGARGAAGTVGGIMNSGVVRGIFRFLRPIAVIFSAFDGIQNAADEMEGREDEFDRIFAGMGGGFVSGFLGSFIGEFANFIKDIPLLVIKQFIPAEYLNEDGTFKRSEDGGSWVSNALAMVEDFDFNRLIRELVQAPFDALGGAFAFLRNLWGAEGTTEAGQAQARAQWDTWWNNWKSLNGIASNVGGIFEVLSNIVFSPINAILAEIERAFTGDEEVVPEGETFTQKISRYAGMLGEFLMDLLPSMDEIKESIARFIGPGNLADWLGLSDYLPMTTEDAERRLNTQFETIQNSIDAITRDTAQLETLNPETDQMAYQEISGRLAAANAALNRELQEADDLRARAARSENVDRGSVQNFNQQFETLYIAGTGAIDAADATLRD
jgi:hypothetical protein